MEITANSAAAFGFAHLLAQSDAVMIMSLDARLHREHEE